MVFLWHIDGVLEAQGWCFYGTVAVFMWQSKGVPFAQGWCSLRHSDGAPVVVFLRHSGGVPVAE